MADSPRLVAMSWSGGKDSTLALERLLGEPGVRVVALLTTVNAEYDRVSIHGVRRSILREQSDALGLPLFEVELGATSSNEEYRAAFARGLTRLREAHPGLESMAFGDIFLADVRSYREALLAELGWRGVYPLWGESTVELSDHFIERGYQAVLTCVDTTLIPTRFAGREYDRELLAELPPEADPCGENGEFHTCVYKGPLFGRRIEVIPGEQVLRDDRFQYCDLLEV